MFKDFVEATRNRYWSKRRKVVFATFFAEVR